MKLKTLLLASLFPLFIYSQTIVGTTKEKKNVILEEYTGIHCGYCPDGHRIAKELKDSHPNDVFIINIHTGSFASPYTGEPDFRTQFGSSFASNAKVQGYPAGSINRKRPNNTSYPGHAIGRSSWKYFAQNTILTEDAYLNVGVKAKVNPNTRLLTVIMEVYYTDNSPTSSNQLNVALLQNNTKGPQSGGQMGNQYVHNHRLIHMVTGQWGETINNTSNSSFVSKTFTYTIPNDHRGIAIDINELEVVAFATQESRNNIISGDGASVSVGSFNNNEFVTNYFNLFPNPSNSGEIQISTPHPNTSLKIYDILGKLVFEKNNLDNLQTINLNTLNQGVYQAIIQHKDLIEVEKIILN